MKFTNILIGAGSAALLLAQPVSAQSVRDWNNAGQSEMRAAASITIPLGGNRNTEKTEPRLDFAVQSYRVDADNAANRSINSAHANRALQRQAVVSLTLDRQPKLMLNGNKIATFGPSLNADDEGGKKGGGGNTVLYVIGGVLVLTAGAATILATDARDAVSDAIGPED